MATDSRYTDVSEEKETEAVTVDKQSTAEAPVVSTSDYSYGFNHEPLDGSQAVRNVGSTGNSGAFFYNISHFTSTGTITVTGCPFTPSRVSVHGSFSDGGGLAFSYGSAQTTSDQGYVSTASNGNSEQGSGTYIATLRNSSGTAIKRLSFSNFTSDGVVLTAPVSAGTANFRIELFP